MKNPIIRYGVFAAVFLAGVNILLWLTLGTPEPEDFRLGEIIGYTTIILSLLFIFFGIRNYRDEYNNGRLSFWKAVGVGLGIAVLPALAFGIYNYVYMELLDPDFIHKYWEYALDKAQAKMSETEFARHAEKMEAQKSMYMSSLFQSVIMFFTVFVIGLVVALVSAFVLKRDQPSPAA